MFKFIDNKIKFNKIEKRQYNQHVIFTALDAGDYFFSGKLNKVPPQAGSFSVDFEVTDNDDVLRINLNIDGSKYHLDVNTQTESATYFTNFLQSFYCLNGWSSIVYVSSSDKVKDFFCVKNIENEPLWRIMALLDSKGERKVIDVCIDEKIFEEKFLEPFKYCMPFNQYIEDAKLLQKYSPQKVKLPLP